MRGRARRGPDNFLTCRSITPPVPAALPLWVLAYSLGIWGFAGLQARWGVLRWCLAGALLGLGLSCLRERGKGKGILLLVCAFALGGLAQARRAPVLEIPALGPAALPAWGGRPEDRPESRAEARAEDQKGEASTLSELLASPELAPDAQWLCEGRVVEAPTATEQGAALRVEVTALRRADALPEAAWWMVSPPLPIAVSVRGQPREPLLPGMPVRLCAALRSPRGGQNPGAVDRVRHASAIGIAALASVEAEALFPWHGPTAEATPPAWPQRAFRQLGRRAARLRVRLLSQISQLSQASQASQTAGAPSATASAAAGADSIAVRSGRAVVAALALGERGLLIQADRERRAQGLGTIDDGFRRAGIYHVLSVSGLHLAVVAWIFYRLLAWLLRWVPGLAGRFVAHRIAALWAMPPTLFYAVLTGAELATQRAALAAALCLLAICCGRRATLSQALAGAVLALAFPGAGGAGTPALLLCEPALLLSIAATVAIAYLRPLGGLPQGWRSSAGGGDGAAAVARELGVGVRRAILAGVRRDIWSDIWSDIWRRIGRAVCGGIGRSVWRLVEGSLAAMLATAPICAFCFSEIQLAGMIGNLIPGLLGEVVVLPLSIFGFLLGLGWPAAGGRLLAAAVLVAQWMVRSATAIAQLGGEVKVPAPHPLLALLFWLGLGLGATGRRLCYCGCALAIAIYLLIWKLPSHELRVTVLDVGQGDAIVVELPEGGVMVVDAGLASAAGVDMGARVVVPFLRRRGYRRIDLAVASHPHPDHTGGLAALMESFPVGELWVVPPAGSAPGREPSQGPLAADRGGQSGDEPQDDTRDGIRDDVRRQRIEPSWELLLQLARQRGIAITTPRTQVLQGVALEVLAPCRSRAGTGCAVASRPDWLHNDNSLVLRLGYAGRTILLPGDIERAGELGLLERPDPLDRLDPLTRPGGAALHADVLKAPHHCSKTSSSQPLIAAVRPQWVVCSLGAYNRYRFPHGAVLARYLAAGSRVLRTDADGAVEIRIAATGTLRVKTYAIPP